MIVDCKTDSEYSLLSRVLGMLGDGMTERVPVVGSNVLAIVEVAMKKVLRRNEEGVCRLGTRWFLEAFWVWAMG